ncbi:MAG: FAD-binding protein, partial [Halobacteriota archaeon]
IETLCRDAPRDIIELEHWGMPFARDDDGKIALRYLAGHSAPRTTYAEAETGHHLLHTLYQQVVKRGITVYDEFYVTNLAVDDQPRPEDRTCHGVVAIELATGDLHAFRAKRGVVLATGGPGQAYDHTTNAVSCTGDGPAMAYRAGVPLEDMEFVQFHPTTLPSTGVLISEGVRGEGGILYNRRGERFMFEYGYAANAGELASRDVVSRAELTEVNHGRGVDDDHVLLDMRHLGPERILDRLENIVHLATDFEGVDPLEEPMPVKPGQHYQMGGIETDEHGRTCIDGLYAAGECACVSVHGANRLGGNALPELVVFGKRAGRHAAGADLGEPRIDTGHSERASPGELEPPVQPGLGDPELAADGAGAEAEDVEGLDPLERALEAERRRIRDLLEREEGVQQAELRAQLQRSMGRFVNVFRNREGIEQALADIREVRERYRDVYVADTSRTFNTDLIQTIELRNLIDVAETIALGALARTESRGAHWRQEHQERDDEHWLKHTFVSWNDGRPELWHKPVILEGESKTYEPKARSY